MPAFDLTISQARAEARMRRAEATLPSGEASNPECRMCIRDLPAELKATLFNLDLEGEDATVPADVLAFYAFNHGSSRALSFASGLPLAALRQAEQRSGWRPKSRALLRAVLRYRGR